MTRSSIPFMDKLGTVLKTVQKNKDFKKDHSLYIKPKDCKFTIKAKKYDNGYLADIECNKYNNVSITVINSTDNATKEHYTIDIFQDGFLFIEGGFDSDWETLVEVPFSTECSEEYYFQMNTLYDLDCISFSDYELIYKISLDIPREQ